MKVMVLETATSQFNRTRFVSDVMRKLKPEVQIFSKSVHTAVRGIRQRKSSKYYHIPDYLYDKGITALENMVGVSIPDLIITYCPITAQLLCNQAFGNQQHNATIAGTTGKFHGVRFMILDDPSKCYSEGIKDEDKAVHKYTIARHLALALYPQPAPKYRYATIQSVEEMEQVEHIASECQFYACDLESQGPIITCIGFAFVMSDDPEDIHCFTLPLFWPGNGDNNPWKDKDTLLRAYQCMLNILTNGRPTAFQNGAFDATQLAAYGIVPTNYCLDTMVMSHAVYPTTRKSLNYLASTCLHEYVYWKDEGKTRGPDGKVKYRAPYEAAGYHTYLDYCGKDVWYTARLVLYYFRFFNADGGKNKPFLRNYIRLFLTQNGPCMGMSWGGLRVNLEGVHTNQVEGEAQSDDALDELRMMTADPNFNPGSSKQVVNYIYNIMRAPVEGRKKRSADKKLLDLIAQTYPIIYPIVEGIKDYKKGTMDNTRFGVGLKRWHGWQNEEDARFYTQLTPTTTKTARLNSRKPVAADGSGSNLQNVTGSARKAFEADPGQYFAMMDYSQADVWYMAAACGDARMIETVMTPGNDSHSIHAADFFCVPLEDVLRGKKEEDPFITDYETGLRNLVKKVVHGTNYGLGAYGMVFNIKRPAAVAICQNLITNEESRDRFLAFVKAKGLHVNSLLSVEQLKEGVSAWPTDSLAYGCAYVQEQYLNRYPALREFRDSGVMDQLRQKHGRITTYGPHTFQVLSQWDSQQLRRFACSCYGQAGTAGMINNAMLRFHCNPKYGYLHEAGIRLALQVHDENIFSLPDDQSKYLFDLYEMMQIEAEYNGHKFTVPVEVELTRVWSKKGKEWKDSMSFAETEALVRSL